MKECDCKKEPTIWFVIFIWTLMAVSMCVSFWVGKKIGRIEGQETAGIVKSQNIYKEEK